MITPDNLSKVAPTLKGERLNKYANGLDTICPQYHIDTPDIVHEFLANCLHESNEFNVLEENLNYKSQALTDLFGRHRISIEDANLYGRNANHPANKIEIANKIYGGEWGKQNLGNINPMDGWVFRGSGIIQLTGRSNVSKFTDYYNQHFNKNYSPEQIADLLRTDIEVGIHSACWFFSIAKNLIQLAINDNMTEVVKRINGGTIGMADRLKYYERCKKYIT